MHIALTGNRIDGFKRDDVGVLGEETGNLFEAVGQIIVFRGNRINDFLIPTRNLLGCFNCSRGLVGLVSIGVTHFPMR